MVINCDCSKPSKSGFLRPAQNAHTYLRFQELVRTVNKGRVEGGSQLAASWPRPPAYRYEIFHLNSKVGNSIPLADIRMGTWVHDIECHPGQGAKLARAAGTYAIIIKEPASQCLVRLPSGVEKLIDSRCRATIGIVSNPNHGARKLRKAGQSRWLGRRPIVRGVAMNPVVNVSVATANRNPSHNTVAFPRRLHYGILAPGFPQDHSGWRSRSFRLRF
jgi:hypothetical protein